MISKQKISDKIIELETEIKEWKEPKFYWQTNDDFYTDGYTNGIVEQKEHMILFLKSLIDDEHIE